jgi:hypothetical protein
VDKESRVPGKKIAGERRKSCEICLTMIIIKTINAAASIRKSVFEDALRKRFLVTDHFWNRVNSQNIDLLPSR